MFNTLKSLIYKINYLLNNSNQYRYKNKKYKKYENNKNIVRQFSTPCTFYQQDFYELKKNKYIYK